MVHDSFATHAPMMGQLNEALREAFVEMYKADNWLARLYQEAKKTLVSDSLPDVPLIGCLDINQVLESEYFFS
jgi:DNA-directed RNA polymerase